MKLDLRMMFEGENMQILDSLNSEFAKIGSTNKTQKNAMMIRPNSCWQENAIWTNSSCR
jgi:hypothetical protein